MGRRSFLFVHSPLVGPSSLRRLAATAASAGHQTALPDLTGLVDSDRPHTEYCRLAVDAAHDLAWPPLVVGHSGAGAFLPSIGEAIGSVAGLVFVDAVVPPVSHPYTTPEPVMGLLDRQTVDGLLGRWLDWWPAETIAELLPNPADRDELAADMPRLPRAFYDVAVPVPVGWSEGPCAYLRLSSAYDAELAEARSRRWPTGSLNSTHLGVVTEPERVLDELLQLVAQMEQS